MRLKVEAANSAVCSAQSTQLVSHGVWQHPSVFLDPAGALVNVVCPPTCAHMQMLTARGRAGGTLGLTGTNQSLQLPAEARCRLSSHSNTDIQSLAPVICSTYRGLCHHNFYPHNTSALTREYLHEKTFK